MRLMRQVNQMGDGEANEKDMREMRKKNDGWVTVKRHMGER
jgi:hypothetical protein